MPTDEGSLVFKPIIHYIRTQPREVKSMLGILKQQLTKVKLSFFFNAKKLNNKKK
jgi:hypothetical protein